MEPITVTRSTHRGLRIAHPVRTSNAEAHADMHIRRRLSLIEANAGGINIPMSIYCCFVFDWIESCEVSMRQNKASSKRLLIYETPTPLIPYGSIGAEAFANIDNLSLLYNKQCTLLI